MNQNELKTDVIPYCRRFP